MISPALARKGYCTPNGYGLEMFPVPDPFSPTQFYRYLNTGLTKRGFSLLAAIAVLDPCNSAKLERESKSLPFDVKRIANTVGSRGAESRLVQGHAITGYVRVEKPSGRRRDMRITLKGMIALCEEVRIQLETLSYTYAIPWAETFECLTGSSNIYSYVMSQLYAGGWRERTEYSMGTALERISRQMNTESGVLAIQLRVCLPVLRYLRSPLYSVHRLLFNGMRAEDPPLESVFQDYIAETVYTLGYEVPLIFGGKTKATHLEDLLVRDCFLQREEAEAFCRWLARYRGSERTTLPERSRKLQEAGSRFQRHYV